MTDSISRDYIKAGWASADAFMKLDKEQVQAEIFRSQLQQAYQEGYSKGFEEGQTVVRTWRAR